METFRTESIIPSVGSVTVDGFSDVVGLLDIIGESVAERVTVPENPFRLVSLRFVVPEAPLMMVRIVGLAAKANGASEMVNG